MQPNYDEEGYPTHRVAGLLYVTMYPLAELVDAINNRNSIDVNWAVKHRDISKGPGFERFANQLEVDFFGKIDNNKIVCVVPIIYPNVRNSSESDTYHLYTYSLGSQNKTNITSPEKLRKDFVKEANPDIMTSGDNLSGFGTIMVSSIANIANGIITAIAKRDGLFLCSITDTTELVPYNVKFDQSGKQFTKAQLEIKRGTNEESSGVRVWELLVSSINDEKISAGVGSINLNNSSDGIDLSRQSFEENNHIDDTAK